MTSHPFRLKTPMLATLIEAPFNDPDWIFEVKWDGYRAIAYKSRSVELLSRQNHSFNTRYPSVVEELKKIKGSYVIDGEIVALDARGLSNFQLLQNYQKREAPLAYYVFDLLFYNGKDLRDRPLIERKKKLEALLTSVKLKHIHYSDHIVEKGKSFFTQAKKMGLEGIMAKRADSLYEERRSLSWQKIKTGKRQEVVIGGFTAPRGSRRGFGALLVGVYEKNQLHYCGHVGGGFNDDLLKSLHQDYLKLVTERCPFINEPHPNAPVTWMKPKLVCEVAFAEWTSEGIMRQPIFKGMRTDKPPKKIIREEPVRL